MPGSPLWHWVRTALAPGPSGRSDGARAPALPFGALPTVGYAARHARDRVGSAHRRPRGALGAIGRALDETFARGPARHLSRFEQVQTALPIADDERVARRAAPEEIGERAREVMPLRGAERLAAPKPHERARRKAFAQGREAFLQPVPLRERRPVERLALEMQPSPLAMGPELDLRDGPIASMSGEPAERFVETEHTARAVGAPERRVQVPPRAPHAAQ